MRSFRSRVYRFYKTGRRDFPWRKTRDPYAIVVSEVMLQQTQTARVAQRFNAFLSAFPNFESLAKAPLRSVLREWQGLGYNRRAVFLKRMAQTIQSEFGGMLPKTEAELLKLPGIGKYTAGAIRAFVFNEPAVFIETNIRAVYVREFFSSCEKITDSEIAALVVLTVDKKNPREWYYALMDLGVVVKKEFPRLNKKSAHYVKQSAFKGSVREIRGRILHLLTAKGPLSPAALKREALSDTLRFTRAYKALLKEGIIQRVQGELLIC